MKKPLIIIAVVLLIIITMNFLAYRYIHYTSKDMIDNIVEIYNQVRAKDWESANSNVEKIENNWENLKKNWAILIDHQEMDNIDSCLSKMKEFVKGKKEIEALAETASLKLLFEHIPEKEELNIRNIL